MGYPELLQVLQEEATREANEVRAAAERERARIVGEARSASRAAHEALVARERVESETRRRAAAESGARERERTLLFERRKHLAALRDEILRRLAGAGSPELDARLLAEVLPEAGDGPLVIVVDPGAEETARASLARLAPSAASRAVVRAAPARRGGVEVSAGRRVLDDTMPARLERAWPEIEADLDAILFGEA